MAELILIIGLGVAVIVLSFLIIIRNNRTKNSLYLDNFAVNELLESVFDNVASGRTSEVVAKVPYILKKYLKCNKIIFFRYNKSILKPEYFFGTVQIDRSRLYFSLDDKALKQLSEFRRIESISRLDGLISKTDVNYIKEMGLSYFFPVFMRDRLYGIFLAATTLKANNPSLNFIAATLAFNLSSAFHIGHQEQRIKRYEYRLKIIESNKSLLTDGNRQSADEILKYLRLKNCQQLLPELLKVLKKDCDFSRLGFYVETDDSEKQPFSIKWNIEEGSDLILTNIHNTVTKCLREQSLFNLKQLDKCRAPMENDLKSLQMQGIDYLISIPWVDKKKALLAISGTKEPDMISARIRTFEKEALPLVESMRRFEKAEELSFTDGLTGMYNIRYFRKKLVEEFSRAKRYNRYLAILILDIDDLKMVNDKYGHMAGDLLLVTSGKVLSKSVRANDVISRYGGDEFCLMMPETDRRNTELFMERIRARIASTRPKVKDRDVRLNLTVSIGGAVFPDDAKTIDDLIHSADMALLRAKKEGRNRSLMYKPEFEDSKEDK